MKKAYLYYFLILFLLNKWSCNTPSGENQFYTLNRETYRDKMKGAWVGQMAGVGWGLPTEFDYINTFIPDDKVPEWNTQMVNQQGNDDLYVEMTFLSTLKKHGLDATIRQAGIDFANTGYTLWAANRTGRRNLRYGIAPPASSHPGYSNNCDDIDYQIEADYSGIMAPGMPNVPIEMGEKFGRLMNYGDGMYGGQFVGAMYSVAYFEDDVKKVIEKALECIPAESDYAVCVRDVLDWHRKYPGDWKKTWQLIEEHYHESYEHQKFAKKHDSWIPIDAKINGAYIVMGLLYGNGDMEQTLKISMQGGKDSDCNPSNAGGILGAMMGYEAIPEKFKKALDVDKKFSYSEYDFHDLLRLVEKFTRELVVKNGGEIIKEKNGKEIFKIRVQKPNPSPYQPSFDPAPVTEDSLYTEKEMKKILAYSSLHFKPVVEKFGLEMEIIHCGKTVKPELVSWNKKENVLATTPMSATRSLLMRFNAKNDRMKKNQTPYLSFKAGHDANKQWKLSIRDRQAQRNRLVLDTVISGNPEEMQWHNFEIALTPGKHANVVIEASAIDGEKAIHYWSDIQVK
jgi:hypothetical protein